MTSSSPTPSPSPAGSPFPSLGPAPEPSSAATVPGPAASPLRALVGDLDPAHLGAPTPCEDFDVRGLLNHLLYWGPVLVAAGRKEPAAPAGSDVDLVGSDVRADLGRVVEGIVTAWSREDAWTGETSMGGPDPLPAAIVGGMAVGELVVHGWDLARALGVDVRWTEPTLEFVLREATRTAELGRGMGVYGPEVPVPSDAPALDRLLAVTGRDPSWTPPR